MNKTMVGVVEEPELANLPNPHVAARRTLHHIDNNPRLATLAAEQLHAAAAALVTRGQLLSVSEKKEGDYEFDGRVRRLTEGLALLSANPDHLAGACAQLAALDQPAVVSPTPSPTGSASSTKASCAPRSTGPWSSPDTTPFSTCARSPPMRSSPATNPRSL
ncbi:hypothetical protein [Streptomyces sp. 840.1]|uniref:hypothetical protein n=1 Tax=Streptomyces sp. 840.1 TaxID=2485152 RepID=UPI0021A33BDD|nr:hypothetical protein [Streptomyces sp. 840.1]